jgi:tetratricopeptide (TPR) repeat protein
VGLHESERLQEQREELRALALKYGGIFLAIVAAILGLAFMVVRMAADTKEDFLARGNALAEDGLYAPAVNEYLSALKLDADYGDAHHQVARAYEGQGDLKTALAESLRAADLLPDDVATQLYAARLLLQVGRFEDADARNGRVLTLAPDNVDGQIVKAAALARIRDLDSAFVLEPMVRLGPADIRPYLLMRPVAGGPRGLPAAEAAFKKAVEGAPSSVAARQALAAFYWLTGGPDAAEIWLRKAVEIDPAVVESHVRLAAYLVAVGRGPEAEAPLSTLAKSTQAPRAQLSLADYYVGQQRLGEARPLLDNLTRDLGMFVQAKTRLARIEHVSGNQPEAHRALAEALAKDSKQIDALILRAQFFLEERKIGDAFEAAQAAITAAPFSGDARAVLGEVLASRGQLDEAIAAFAEAVQLAPGLFTASVRLTQLHLQNGDAQAASQLADQLVRDVPLSVGARLLRSQALIALGDLAAAEGDVADILAATPTLSPAHALMAEVHVKRGNPASARREFERALELEPRSIQALRGQVALDLAEKRLDRARTAVERGLQVSPSDSALLTQAASVYAATGDVAKAEAALTRLIELEPSNLDAFTALTNLYRGVNRLEQALASFESVSLGPAAVGAQTMVGIILEALVMPEEARVVYERLLVSKPPDAAVASNNLARLYVASGDNLETAIQLARDATRRRPASPEFNDTLGWVSLTKGDTVAAVRALEASVAASPDEAMYRYRLGLAYAQSGQSAKAREQLTVALKLKPGYPEARRALEEATAKTPSRARG